MTAADRICLVFALALGLALAVAVFVFPPDDEPFDAPLHSRARP